MLNHQKNITDIGFTVIEDVYSPHEIEDIIATINKTDKNRPAFRKTNDLFAIRQFLKEVPEIKSLIFNENLKSKIGELFDGDFFVVKSIYFDKPEKSNWFVAWHQDLTVAVNHKAEIAGYGPWTVKLNSFAVQPPIAILQNNFTIRIHLDDTDEGNGALKVIAGSHNDIHRAENINWHDKKEITCNIQAGGIMVMRPLLMHASARSVTDNKRRVVHVEFSSATLPAGLSWAEMEEY